MTELPENENNLVSNTVSDVYINRSFKGNYDVEIMKSFLFKKDNKFYKINTLKQFVKPFSSEMKSVIEQYIEINNLNFNKESDLIKLINFCNEKDN